MEQDFKENVKEPRLKSELADSFLLLKLRYPDKIILLEWAERELGIGK